MIVALALAGMGALLGPLRFRHHELLPNGWHRFLVAVPLMPEPERASLIWPGIQPVTAATAEVTVLARVML